MKIRGLLLLCLFFVLGAGGCGDADGLDLGGGSDLLSGSVNFPGPYPTPGPVAYQDAAGTNRSVLAYPGQVVLLFADDPSGAGPSNADLEAAIIAQGGTILETIPRLRFFLVQVTPLEEGAFIQALRGTLPTLRLAVPNVAATRGQAEAVVIDNSCWVEDCVSASGAPVKKYVPLNVGPGVVVLDDFNDFQGENHGQDVYQTVLDNGGTVSARVQLPVLANGAVPGDKLVASVVAIQAGAALFAPGENVVANLSFNAGGESDPDYESNWYCMAEMIDEALNATNDQLDPVQRQRFILVQEIGNSGQDVSQAFALIRQKQVADGTDGNHLFVGGSDGTYATRVDDPNHHSAVAWYKGCIAPGKCGSSFAAPAVAAFIERVGGNVDATLGQVAHAVTDTIADSPDSEPFIIEGVATSVLTIRIAPDDANMGKDGGQGSIDVTAAEGVAWTAFSSAPWLTIVSGATGAGNGTVVYAVAPWDGTDQRFATITISGETFFLTQYGSQVTSSCCCQQTCPCGGYPSATCEEHCPCCVAACIWVPFPNCYNEPVHDTRCVTTETAEAMTPDQCSPQNCWNRVSW